MGQVINTKNTGLVVHENGSDCLNFDKYRIANISMQGVGVFDTLELTVINPTDDPEYFQ
jgi:hypothetical protein